MLIDTIRDDMMIARKNKDKESSAILQTVIAEIDRMNGLGNGTVFCVFDFDDMEVIL